MLEPHEPKCCPIPASNRCFECRYYGYNPHQIWHDRSIAIVILGGSEASECLIKTSGKDCRPDVRMCDIIHS